ncbi:MAG: hypothetical protein CR217_18500, partial [Beijerinckiaceae bacterium]
DHEDPRNKAWSSMLASNPVPTLNQQKADLGIPRDSLKPHPALGVRQANAGGWRGHDPKKLRIPGIMR